MGSLRNRFGKFPALLGLFGTLGALPVVGLASPAEAAPRPPKPPIGVIEEWLHGARPPIGELPHAPNELPHLPPMRVPAASEAKSIEEQWRTVEKAYEFTKNVLDFPLQVRPELGTTRIDIIAQDNDDSTPDRVIVTVDYRTGKVSVGDPLDSPIKVDGTALRDRLWISTGPTGVTRLTFTNDTGAVTSSVNLIPTTDGKLTVTGTMGSLGGVSVTNDATGTESLVFRYDATASRSTVTPSVVQGPANACIATSITASSVLQQSGGGTSVFCASR